MNSMKIAALLVAGLSIAGCTSNPWVDPFKKERAASQASGEAASTPVKVAAYPVKRSDLNWEGVMSSVAGGSTARQKAVVAYLEQKLATRETADIKLRLAFMLGFSSDGMRDQVKALSLYKQLSDEEREQLSTKMLPALAVVMLTELQLKRGQIWWLKKDKEKLLAEKAEREAHIKRLEDKLKAIRSIEESIHQRNR
ncbi:MAG TPA: hypothetical protein ENK35_12840 [Candidatus Tenderia sp.]|nr:hypothetical protein [Candidatus Tenderia sp.]